MDIIRIKIGKLRIGSEILIIIFFQTSLLGTVWIIDAAMFEAAPAETGKLLTFGIVMPQNAVLDVWIILIVWIAYCPVIRKKDSFTPVVGKSTVVKNRHTGWIEYTNARISGF